MALELEAINPVRVGPFFATFAVVARWEVTCGLCRTRFRRYVFELRVGSIFSWVACPECGTHNLLPHHPKIRARNE